MARPLAPVCESVKTQHRGKQHANQWQPSKQEAVHSPWNGHARTKQLFVSQGRAVHRALPKYPVAIGSSSSADGSRVSPGEKRLPTHEYLLALPVAHSCIDHFHLTMEHSWALLSLLEHFSNIIQGIVGISGLKIILCPSVLGNFN